MIKEEWKGLFKNKFMYLVFAALLIIPTLYNAIFLSSMWDPYGKLSDLPVAVVNLDEPAWYEDKEFTVGDSLVDQLKENKSLDFHFVSQADADKGLADGDYYMVMTIPKNFSQNATTLISDKPEEMVIDYQTSQGHNYTASKMSNSAMTEIRSKISEKVTQMYTETILSQFGVVGEGMQTAADGTSQLLDGTSKLQEGSQTIQENLNTLASSSLTFAEGSDKLQKGLATYVDGVVQVDAGVKQLAGATPALQEGVGQLATGSSQLQQGVVTYTNGVNQVNAGLGQFQSKLPALTSGISQLAGGTTQLSDGVSQYTAGVSQVASGATQLNDGLSQLQQQTASLPQSVTQLNEGAQQLASQLSQVKLDEASQSQLKAYVSGVQTYLTTVESALSSVNVDQTKGQMAQVQSSLQALQGSLGAIQSSLAQATASTPDYASAIAGIDLTDEQRAQVLSALNSQRPQVDVSATAMALQQAVSNLQAVASALQGVDLTALDKIPTLQAATTQLASNSSQASAGINSVVDGIYKIANQAAPGMQQIANGTNQLAQGMPTLTAGVSQLATGSQQLAAGTSQLTANSPALVSGAQQLATGVQTMQAQVPALTSGVDQLAQGTSQLAANSPQLVEGSTALATGLLQLNQQVPTLVNGITQLSDGTGQLVDNSPTLVDGTAQLTDGAVKISDGAGQLATGEGQVVDGLQTASDGIQTLNDKLSDGATQIAKVSTTKANSDAIATPVSAQRTDNDDVPNNGTAMAPYMLSVALFVGSITANVMYDAFTPKKRPTSSFAWLVSKLSVVIVMAVLEASIVYFVLTNWLGLAPLNPGQTLLLLIAEAIAYMTLVTFFNVILGKVGAFLMLIFLILQLAGSGGTYPLALSNSFFQAIHPYLPMSYGIDGLRTSLSIGGSIQGELMVFVSIAVASIAALWIFFEWKFKRESFEPLRLIEE